MFKVAVGEKITSKYVGREGVITEINDCGIETFIFMNNIDDLELNEMISNNLKVGLFEKNDILFFLYKFGNLSWMDSPYTSHLSVNLNNGLEELVDNNNGYPMKIIIVESSTGIVRGIRLVALPKRYSVILKKAVDNQLSSQTFSAIEYNLKINSIYRAYSTKQMVNMSKVTVSI